MAKAKQHLAHSYVRWVTTEECNCLKQPQHRSLYAGHMYFEVKTPGLVSFRVHRFIEMTVLLSFEPGVFHHQFCLCSWSNCPLCRIPLKRWGFFKPVLVAGVVYKGQYWWLGERRQNNHQPQVTICLPPFIICRRWSFLDFGTLVQLPLSWSTDCYYWHLVGNTETLLLDTPKKRRRKKNPQHILQSVLYGLVPHHPGEEKSVSERSANVSRTKTDTTIHYMYACADTTGRTAILGLKTKCFYWDMIDHGQSCDGQLKEEILLLW